MNYTLRQATPLLNKAELALFESSRRGAVGELTAKQLASRITRVRALRDKYRDQFRRQTVATRTGPASARADKGGENARTQMKAEIMAQTLERLEAQHVKAEAKMAVRPTRKSPHNAPGAPAKKTNPKKAQQSRRTRGDAAPGPGADLPMRGASTTKPRQIARKTRVAQDVALEVVKQRGAASTRTTSSAARPAAAKRAVTSARQPAEALVKAVRKAVVKKQATPAKAGKPTARKGSRTLVGGTGTALAHGAVPTSMPAVAARLNPLKAEPVNKKIHASARGRAKVHQARKDGR